MIPALNFGQKLVPHGIGRWIDEDKDRLYDGQWLEGNQTGYGRFVYSNGNMYTGAVLDCLKHGVGTF